MKNPITGKEMVLKKEKRSITFRKEVFEVIYHYYLCQDSKEQFTTTELDDLNLNQAYNQYRVMFNLPFPEEIRKIREKYDLSAKRMSEILGFGVNGYRNYESGEVPNQSNARLIQVAEDSSEFLQLVKFSENSFEKSKFDKLVHKIEILIDIEEKNKFSHELQNYLLGEMKPDANTGYKQPDLNKLTEMVVFFTEIMEPWKTKLNKLLFYADFLFFKNAGYSMSGIRYRAINLGPVPNNFDVIFNHIDKQDDIDIDIIPLPDGGAGYLFKPNTNRKFNPELFNESELQVLNQVAEKFKKTSASQIRDISHLETAWIDNYNNGKKLIDYNYSFDLKAI